VRKCVTVEELHRPVEDSDEASKETPDDGLEDITFSGRRLSSDRAELAQTVDDGDNQTSKTDAAKAVCEGPPEGTAGDILGIVARVKVPERLDEGAGKVT